jgi:23S rRNA (uracil1939-C5)-methyltransferase
MLIKDQILEIKVLDFANEGKSISRYNDFVVFIDNAIPGDVVELKIYKVKKNFAFGKAIKIITPSELRVNPRCSYFGVCGGCKWQNLEYKSQLGFKRKGIIDSLERIGKIENPEVNEVISSDLIYFFRNKMEFSFSDKRWLLEEEKDKPKEDVNFALGLHIPERFDKVLDIKECLLESETSNGILNFTRDFSKENNLDAFSPKAHTGYLRNLVIREGKKTNQIMVNLVTYDDRPELMEKYSSQLLKSFPSISTIINNITERRSQVAIGDYEKILHGPGYIEEKLGEFIFRISPNSFFQTNTLGTEKLYSVIKDYAVKEKNKIIWDLYCGAGTISIFLSKYAEKIFGFEIVESAIKDARLNTEINNINNCEFISGDLKDNIIKDSFPTPDLIILDPPRSGVHEQVLREILLVAPSRIIYVSCNPQTQARDLIILNEKYNIRDIQPVDMFPHTMHIENVIYLCKKPE